MQQKISIGGRLAGNSVKVEYRLKPSRAAAIPIEVDRACRPGPAFVNRPVRLFAYFHRLYTCENPVGRLPHGRDRRVESGVVNEAGHVFHADNAAISNSHLTIGRLSEPLSRVDARQSGWMDWQFLGRADG